MSGVNKAIIIGRLGQDPEVRQAGDTSVCNFSVATSETYTDKSGQRQEKTEWHRIVAWGRTAELCGEYLKKGREVYIEGKLETREWPDKDGNKRSTTEIKAERVQFIGGRQDDGGSRQGGQAPRQSSRPAAAPARQAAPANRQAYVPADDEMPF